MSYKSLDKQVQGNHYQDFKIQPAEFVNQNKLLFAEGNAIKYICRHSRKGKHYDIKGNTLFRNDSRKGLWRIYLTKKCGTHQTNLKI